MPKPEVVAFVKIDKIEFTRGPNWSILPAFKGLYDDCIHDKGNTLLLLVSEVFGGVGMGEACAFSLASPTRRARARIRSTWTAPGMLSPSTFITRALSRKYPYNA